MKYKELQKHFLNPPDAYSPAPFWSINSTMDLPTIRSSLEDLRSKGFDQVIIHPRSGLEVEYLSEEYWDGMDVIVSELARLGVKGWIYDDYNWPSGIAGGKLLRDRPEFRQRGLNFRIWKAEKSVELKGKLIAAFDIDAGYKPLAGQEGLRTFIPQNGSKNCLLFWEEFMTDRTFASFCAPWAGNELGVLDYMSEKAVDYFMELTHRQYEKRYGDHFRKTLIGFFTDEPQNYRGLMWSADFRERFRERAGYDLTPVLYHLAVDSPDAVKTRCDFYRIGSELYRERYFDKIAKWCEERGLIFTGHLGMEENLMTMAANHGSVFQPLSAMGTPGIDMLGVGHPYGNGLVNAEVPNFAPKVVSSVAHLLGRKRTLVELWGGGGWAASPARLKKPLDWMFATGINFINPHLAWVSAKGLRKRDFPQSFSAQQPWWNDFAPFSEYISRLSALLSEGVHQARVLVVFPVTGIWAASKGRGKKSAELKTLVDNFKKLTDELLIEGHDFDYLFEDAVRMYIAGNGYIRAGNELFDAVIVPQTKCLCKGAVKLLQKAAAAGIHIAAAGGLPQYDENGGPIKSELEAIVEYQANGENAAGKIVAWLDDKAPPRVRIVSERGRVILAHHRRVEDADVIFVAELTEKADADAAPVTLRLRGMNGRVPRVWNPEDGDETIADFKNDGADIVVTLKIFPGRSLVVVVPDETSACEISVVESEVHRDRKIIALENWTRRPFAPNILPLEPCVIRAPRQKPRPLSRLRRDRRFPLKAKIAAIAARAAIAAMRTIRPPEKHYRFERYFDFEQAFKMAPLIERYLGLSVWELGPYEFGDLMDEWVEYLNVPPGLGKTFPPPGAGYSLHTKIKLDHIPDDVALVYEDIGEPIAIYVNDKKAPKGDRGFVWDDSNYRAPLSELLRRGENKIAFESRQPDYATMYPTIHAPEPVALIGTFRYADGRISPAGEISGPLKSWTYEGYPYYCGAMAYRTKLSLERESYRRAVISLGDVKETAQVKVNGVDAGKKLWPPFDFEVARFLRKGDNEIEAIVRNTAANFFHRPQPSGLLGPVNITLDV